MSPQPPEKDAAAITRIHHSEAMKLAAEENRQFLILLEQLRREHWSAPTDCTRWTVRDIAVHVIASAEAQASPREFLRQVWQGRKLTRQINGHHWVDGLNEAQLRARTELEPEGIAARWRNASAAALRARRRLPGAVRALPVLPLGRMADVDFGWQPLSYLFDVGFTRDVWMHRIDICRATGQPLNQTRDHDGRIVEDLIAEWATRHQDPFCLILTGPAGGRFSRPAGFDDSLQIDAIECCRILSGRGQPTGVLQHLLPL
ncbi:maleylpyruvate isomerase family mycothiol-dependent enzyme [Arthrobacter sp. SAFR-044]|uniref:maleylpyruvate isomerase family mycothiol-dependent enzyme n=1 Tax=Arthrobacter sp. SAFR-044 TaxID=3387278 RepID=UPI003F7B9205